MYAITRIYVQVEKAAENKERKSGGKIQKDSEVKKDKKVKESGAVLKFDATDIEDLNINAVKAAFSGLPTWKTRKMVTDFDVGGRFFLCLAVSGAIK